MESYLGADVVENIDDDQEQNNQERHSTRYNLSREVTMSKNYYYYLIIKLFVIGSMDIGWTFGSMMKLIQETITKRQQGI